MGESISLKWATSTNNYINLVNSNSGALINNPYSVILYRNDSVPGNDCITYYRQLYSTVQYDKMVTMAANSSGLRSVYLQFNLGSSNSYPGIFIEVYGLFI